MAAFAFVLLLTTATVFGQTERTADRTVAEKFEQDYNHGNDDAIFDSFSTEMKRALPLEKTKEFLANLRFQAGKIVRREFINYYHNTAAVYKTKFERATMTILLTIDSERKIAGLYVKPYVETDNPETIARRLRAKKYDLSKS
jgi:hypothetical protein